MVREIADQADPAKGRIVDRLQDLIQNGSEELVWVGGPHPGRTAYYGKETLDQLVHHVPGLMSEKTTRQNYIISRS